MSSFQEYGETEMNNFFATIPWELEFDTSDVNKCVSYFYSVLYYALERSMTEMPNRKMESGVQLFSRVKSENSQSLNGICPHLFPEGGPYNNQVIEYIFPFESDYTDFLIDFIVKVILPSRLSPEFKENHVIFLHTDMQINLFKVIKILEKNLDRYCKLTSNDKKKIIDESLRRFIVLNCFTAEQMEITFFNLERIINNCQNPGLVVLDNCLSQYWTYKFANFMLSFDEHCIKIIGMLYDKIKDLNVVLLYGRPCTSNNLKRGKEVGYSIHVITKDDVMVAKIKNFEKNHSFEVNLVAD